MANDANDSEDGFESFREVLRASEPASTDLKREIDIARRRLAATETVLDELRDARRLMVLAGGSKRQEHREALAGAEAEIEDLRICLEAMEDRLPAALEREDDARRHAILENALALRDAAAETLAKEYPEIGRRLQKLARAVFEADIAVEHANQHLPEGMDRLASVEAAVRDLPGREPKILSEEVVEVWHYANRAEAVPEEAARRIHADPGGRTGQIPLRASVNEIGSPSKVLKIPMRKVVAIPGESVRAGNRLSVLHLPGLRAGDPDFLAKPHVGSFGIVERRDATQALRAMNSAAPADVDEPQPKTEFIRLDSADTRR